MYGLLFIAAIGTWMIFRHQDADEVKAEIPSRFADKLNQLWDIAQESLSERKYLRAEKALLTILRVDERNATAYNRLGILYAKQHAYKDAIECFEIAQSLEPSASSLHNVGLIHYETENYEKAALAFEQALAMDENHASRHIAYAKVQEKLGHTKKMFASLERAVEIEPSVQSYNILADTYERHGRVEEAEAVRSKLRAAVNRQNTPQRVKPQRRRVIM